MAFQYVLPHTVTAQLDSLRRRVRRVAFLRGCGLFLTLSCGLLISIALTDFLLDLTSTSRLLAFLGFCFVEAVLAAFLLIRPLVIPLKDAEVATLAEERFPELGERVSSLVELSDPDIPESEKGSSLMRDLLEEETIRELARCDFNEAVSTRPAIRRLSYGVGTLSFLILSLLIFPSVSSLLLARLFKPWGNYASVSRLTFDIQGGEKFVARGDDIEITARMTWRNGSDAPIPEPVELAWQSDNGNADVRTLRFDPDSNVFATVIPNVQDSLRFFVSSAGSRSRQFDITVLDRPEVLTAKLEITPPGYLGQPRESIDGVTGDIPVFEHSRLEFDLTFSHPVEEASINWLAPMILPESELAGDQQVKPLDDDSAEESRRSAPYTNDLVAVDNLPATQLTVSEDRLSAHLAMPATIQGAFQFLLKESHGLTSNGEPHRQINIIRDQPPLLKLHGGHQDRARPTDVYGIRVSATDDVALEKIELHVTSREGLNEVIRAPQSLLGQESLEHEFRIDLADVAVASGDFLKLQIRAVDGRPIPAPNEVWSEIRYVAISDDASAQGTGDVLARQEQIRKELRDIRDRLQAAVEQSDQLQAEAQRSLNNDRQFAQQQAIQNLASDEEDLAARLAALADRFSRHPLFASLSDDLWKMAADELDPVAIKLADSPQQDLKDQITTIGENSTVVDLVDEKVSSIAAEFEKLADLEDDLLELNRIAQRARQLVDDARQLEQRREEVVSQAPDATDTLDAETAQRQEELQQELAEDQQVLTEEQSELVAALENLLQQRPELLQAARDHQLEKLANLAEQANNIAEPQELLAESLQQNAQQAQQAAAPLAERQQKISQQVDQLAAQSNAQQSRQLVTPIDPELARQIADELKKGNLAQAEELAKQAQQDLAALAKELSENAQLPADPKAAAAELAERQQALTKEIAATQPNATPDTTPETDTGSAPAPSSSELRNLAARQAALQMAAAQLQTDRKSRDEQQAAVHEAAETLQKLIEAAKREPAEQAEAIGQAARQSDEAAAAMEQLAENILSEEQQREEALEELQRLRKEDGTDNEDLSDEELARRLPDLLNPPRPEPQQVAQQARQLAGNQQELREQTETLDDEFSPEGEERRNTGAAQDNQARAQAAAQLAEQQADLAEQAAGLPSEIGALERAEAVAELDEARQALENGDLQAAATAQRQAQAALENFARQADALSSSPEPPGQQVAASGPTEPGSEPPPADEQPASGQSPENSIPASQAPSRERLAAQAQQLADIQQELQQAIAELEPQPAIAQSDPAQSDDTSPTSAAGSDSAAPSGQQQAQETLSELLAQQEALTDQAAQLAVQTAQQTGADSAATQAAVQTAQQSAQAESAARGGQFGQAASEAARAQQSASESTGALEETAPALAEQARQLADQQQQMAEAFGQLDRSPAQRAAAQQARQQQLAAEADQIAQSLDELAGQLGAQPLDLQQQSEQATSAQQSAQQGQQSASQAAQSLQTGNQNQAAQSAQQAADALRQSARQAAANAAPSSSESPVPGEFAAQIADAMRQLQAAQQQLAQAAPSSGQAGQPSAEPAPESGQPASASSDPGAAALNAETGEAATAQPSSGESPPGSAESSQEQTSPGNAPQPPSDTPTPNTGASGGQASEQPSSGTPDSNGQPGPSLGRESDQQAQQRNGALAAAADSLQQAAELLSDATQQLAADGSQSGDNQSGDNQGQSNQQPSSQQPGLGNSGTGAFVAGDIGGPLDTELKRRAMKNWGRLPGNLKTEILQSSQRKANGDYAKLIKLYFEELAKADQSTESRE